MEFERGIEEKQALALHRYKNWIATMQAREQEVTALQQQVAACVEQMIYAYLEAREEQEHLIASGLSREQIEAVGVIPALPMDPLVIVRQAKVVGS